MVNILLICRSVLSEASMQIDASDLIIALISAIVGAFAGAFFGVFGNIVQTKMGKINVKALRTSAEINGDSWDSVEVVSVILLENSKMIPVSFYNWKVNMYTNVDVLSCQMDNAQADEPRFLDVVTLQPNESKQIMLKCTIDLKTHIMFKRKIHESEDIKKAKKEYKVINKVDLEYNSSLNPKSVTIEPEKFLHYTKQ